MAANKYPPSLIANMDETYTAPRNNSHEKVIVVEGAQRTARPIAISTAVAEHVTTVFTIFADGTSAKPTMILPLKTILPSAAATLSSFSFASSKNGWMTRPIFASWASGVFVPEIQRRREVSGAQNQRALLILDNHNSRANSAALRALSDAQVDVLTLPAHTSHILQPLDQEVNMKYKAVLSEVLSFPDGITKEKKREILLAAAVDAAIEAQVPRLVKTSFDFCGIFPFDATRGINSKFVLPSAKEPEPSPNKFRISMENRVITDGSFINLLADAEAMRAAKKQKNKSPKATADQP